MPDTPSLFSAKRACWSALEIYLDAMVDHLPEDTYDRVEALKAALFCFDGHAPIDDHCGMPAHRRCLFCEQLTPDAPLIHTEV